MGVRKAEIKDKRIKRVKEEARHGVCVCVCMCVCACVCVHVCVLVRARAHSYRNAEVRVSKGHARQGKGEEGKCVHVCVRARACSVCMPVGTCLQIVHVICWYVRP